jgi:type I site-specific restriction endonuclease
VAQGDELPYESESATRKKRIDQALAAAGWRVVPRVRWLAGDRTAAVLILI